MPERTESAKETLLRELARMSRQTLPSSRVSQPGGVTQEVLAEVNVEGTTYRFSRLRRPPQRISLTPRELQIARMVARGLPTKAIAADLGSSPWTVLTHLRRVYTRLGVSSRAAMVARLITEGVLWDMGESPQRAGNSVAGTRW